jgi:hypothetical protein
MRGSCRSGTDGFRREQTSPAGRRRRWAPWLPVGQPSRLRPGQVDRHAKLGRALEGLEHGRLDDRVGAAERRRPAGGEGRRDRVELDPVDVVVGVARSQGAFGVDGDVLDLTVAGELQVGGAAQPGSGTVRRPSVPTNSSSSRRVRSRATSNWARTSAGSRRVAARRRSTPPSPSRTWVAQTRSGSPDGAGALTSSPP